MNTKDIAREIISEIAEQTSKPFIFSSHNFKIDMKLFFHSLANVCRTDKNFSLVYYIMNTLSSDSTVLIYNKSIISKMNISKKTYYDLINRMVKYDIVRKIDINERGYFKLLVNPYMIYNYRKTKNRQYVDNCMYWNLLIK